MVSLNDARENHVLALLRRRQLQLMLPDLEARDITALTVLQPRGLCPDEAAFPVDAVASMLALNEAGESVEVATIGCEGMIGLPLFLGSNDVAVQIATQVPGRVLCIKASAFRRYCADPPLMRLLHLYTQVLVSQLAQVSVCNRLHRIEQRTARWLLQCHDRVRGKPITLTHDRLAGILGIRRASLSEAAAKLLARGLIHYHRGVISVLNRAKPGESILLLLRIDGCRIQSHDGTRTEA